MTLKPPDPDADPPSEMSYVPPPAPPDPPEAELEPSAAPEWTAPPDPEPVHAVVVADDRLAAPPPEPRAGRKRSMLVLAVVAVLAAGGAAFALAGSGSDEPATTAAADDDDERRDTPAADENDKMAPLPTPRPKLVEPVAGEVGLDEQTADLPTAPPDNGKDPKVTGPASGSTRDDLADPGVSNLSADTATALPNGVALPPLEAPEAVLDVIRAGNIIARSPYKWGGGHGRFQDNGYDCSGSVSYALYYAGLIDGPHVSGELMAYGKPGPGKWITIYANPGHVYMEVAGIRFDTSGARTTGSRWQNELRNNAGYEARHPEGL